MNVNYRCYPFAPEKKPENREEMIGYISNHSEYWRMHSWNGITRIANRVKIYDLNLTQAQEDKAWEILTENVDASEYHDAETQMIANFYEETGYRIFFNGQSGGYVFLDADFETDSEELDEWETSDLKEISDIIYLFDCFCDDLRNNLVWFLNHSTIVTEEVVYTKTVKRLEVKE